MPAQAVQSPEATWRQHYATGRGERHWPAEELVRFAGRRGGFKHETVLEVGCGNGANVRLLRETAHRVIGVDLLPDVLGDVQRHKAVSVAAGDARRLPVRDGMVDGIADVMTSQHVPWHAHKSLYAEFRRVAGPEAWLFVYHLGMGTTTTGAAMSGTFTYHGLPLFPDAGLICLPPRWALAECLASVGWRVQEQRAMTRTYPDGTTAVYHVIEGEAV